MPAEDVFDLGEHLRDGLWRVDSASLPDLRGVSGVAIAGEPAAMEAARLAVDGPVKPVTFGEAPFEGALVVCLSYDGESGVDALEAASGPVVVATTGGPLAARAREAGHKVVPIPAGFTPSSAVGYWVSIVTELLARAGAQASRQSELEAAADAVEALVAQPPSDVDALTAARSYVLAGRETALQSSLSAVLLIDIVVSRLDRRP